MSKGLYARLRALIEAPERYASNTEITNAIWNSAETDINDKVHYAVHCLVSDKGFDVGVVKYVKDIVD